MSKASSTRATAIVAAQEALEEKQREHLLFPVCIIVVEIAPLRPSRLPGTVSSIGLGVIFCGCFFFPTLNQNKLLFTKNPVMEKKTAVTHKDSVSPRQGIRTELEPASCEK